MTWLRLLSLLCLCAAPSCLVYDESLLDFDSAATGGSGDGGLGSGVGGGTGGDAGAAGTPSGGAPSSGGANSADGGTSGSGGSTSPEDCELVGATGPFTGVGTTTLIDDFEVTWRYLNGQGFNGQWFAVGDAAGSGMSPTVDEWSYAEQGCAPGNHALHVVAAGYTAWGVSYDAELWSSSPPSAGVSGYTGIVFWARTDRPGVALKVGLTDPQSEVTREVNVPPLTRDWKQYKFPLSAFTAVGSLDLTKVRVVQLVGVAAADIDFWIDDLSFYTQ
jgi:hypothetical protein